MLFMEGVGFNAERNRRDFDLHIVGQEKAPMVPTVSSVQLETRSALKCGRLLARLGGYQLLLRSLECDVIHFPSSRSALTSQAYPIRVLITPVSCQRSYYVLLIFHFMYLFFSLCVVVFSRGIYSQTIKYPLHSSGAATVYMNLS